MIGFEIKKSEEEAEQLSFAKSSILIGRASGNDIAIEAPGVSRYHARVSVHGEKIFIEDLGSTNGTYVNSQKILNATELNLSDTIIIGSTKISLIACDDPSEFDIVAEPNIVPLHNGNQKITNVFIRGEDITGKKPVVEIEAQVVEETITKKEEEVVDFYWASMKNFLTPIWNYITNKDISEIMINGNNEIYIESKGILSKAPEKFTTHQLQAAVINIAQFVGRRISEEEPYLDARLPDGSRVAILLSPCSRKGTAIAIRKFSKEKLTLNKLLELCALSSDILAYLEAAVILKKNILIAGGTSSGKTSLLNVISSLIPAEERIITIEDSAELQLNQEHVLPMETRQADKKGKGEISIRDLVKASLRMRPDRLIVGEIRGGEALDLLQAMNTGHSGSMSTIHASSPKQALSRLETLALFSGVDIPIFALREQVSSAVEVIIQANRLADHSRKIVSVAEVDSLGENGEYRIREIFKFASAGLKEGKIQGRHIWTGNKTSMLEEMELAGLEEAKNIFLAQN